MTGRILSRGRSESGQSLVIALLVLTFLAIALGGVMFFTAGNQRTSNLQKAQQVANSLAEAGINNAVSVLSQAAVCTAGGSCNAGNSHLIPPAGGGNSTLLPTAYGVESKTYPSGTVTWYGTVNSSWVWTLHARATVPNPTGAAAIVKYMTAQVQVNAPPPSSFQVAVWNTVYSPGTGQICDTSVNQGVTINVPFYVGGNLCMANQGGVNAPVYVGGNLNISNKQAFIGCSKVNSNTCSTPAPINSAHVGGWCAGPSGTQYSPCKSEPMTGGAKDTNIYVTNPTTWNPTGVASDFVGVVPPTICWGPNSCTGDPDGGWYTVSSPGPLNPCTSSTGTPPTFDNDTTMNDSVLTTFNLTPAASYTCTTPQGQLSYNAGTRTLTIAGTVFIDGNVTMTTTGNQPITYTGTGSGGACTNVGDCQSVLYASGDITVNSELLCAVVSGNTCDWNNWNPNKKILILASNGPNGITVGPSQSAFQGGLYATNTVTTGQSAQTEGPLVSGTKVVSLGQQFGGTFPPITILPLSIQQPPGGFWISPPTKFASCSGSNC
jgi:Tfp pilus assembly protein PilX